MSQLLSDIPTLTLAQSLTDWWLGLSRLSAGDSDLSIGWRYELPAWGWALVVLAALALAGWSYHRLTGPGWGKAVLAAARAGFLVLLALLLAGPMLVRVDEQVEPDRLLMLVDRSASMQVRDLVGADDQPLSRDQAVRQALAEHQAIFQQPRDNPQRRIEWLGFGGDAFPIEGEGGGRQLPEADRQATRLAAAIQQSLARAAGHPVAGIVLITDGRSPQSTGQELIGRLDEQAVSIFSVPVGAEQLPMDLAVGEVEAPDRAFVEDLVPVSATVEQLGGDGEAGELPQTLELRLVDTATGEVLDRRQLSPEEIGQRVRLSARAETVGQVRWRLELGEPEGPQSLRELDEDNNQQTVTIQMIDRPIRVLYIEGYPRWEYRYLKNLLIREDSIESSMWLLSADREFAQEGDNPISRLPQNAEEMRRYDVVIVGDVPPETFSTTQMQLLRDHVAQGGAGVLWIGGPRQMPQSLAATPLAAMLPMVDPGAAERYLAQPRIEMRPTPLADRLSVLQLSGAGEPTGDQAWPDRLPAFQWAQQIGPLKPAAEVLARAVEAEGPAGQPLPLVSRMRFGAGQSLHMSTDETWRWRYGQGELYFQQFWIQLVRMLGRGRVQQLAAGAELEAAHRRINLGQTTVVSLRLTDPSLADLELSDVALAVRPASAPDSEPIDRLTLRPTAEQEETGLERTFQANWSPNDVGNLLLTVEEPALSGHELSEDLEVTSPNAEMANVKTDRDRLETLAEATGGEVLELSELDQLPERVPNRARIRARDVSEPIWHSPLAFVLALVLLTFEWIGRKAIRLV